MDDATRQAQLENGRVAVLYHYFAHYREPINLELIEHGDHRYEFFGDTDNHNSGIKLTAAFPDDRFHKVKGRFLGPLFLQPGAIPMALSPKYKALILLGNPKWPTTWLAALLGRLTGKRVLYWAHGWLRVETGAQRTIRNTLYKLGHALLVYGHRAKAIGVNHMGFKPGFIHVIYNSLDTKSQDAVRATISDADVETKRAELFPGREHLPVVINVTRLNRFKRLDMLLEAAAKVRDRGTDLNLLIVGEGEHKPELEALAHKLDLNCVFTGAVYDERELARMIMSARVTVMPGPVGLTAMHSLAYGTPVITNDDLDAQMPEYEAIAKGISGDFYKAGDTDDLARTIERWIQPTTENHQRTAAARSMIEKYYNPTTQRRLIDAAVAGRAPDDLGFPTALGTQRSEPQRSEP